MRSTLFLAVLLVLLMTCCHCSRVKFLKDRTFILTPVVSGTSRSSLTVSWKLVRTGESPRINTGNSQERDTWSFSVYYKYIVNGKIELGVNKVNQTKWYSRSQMQHILYNILPCTDYYIWVIGIHEKSDPRTKAITRKRIQSPSILISTSNSELIEIPKYKDITIKLRKNSLNQASASITWIPTVQPFGCPTLGFNVYLRTPEQWPKEKSIMSSKFNVNVTNLKDEASYMFRLGAYNNFNRNHRFPTKATQFYSEYVYLSFNHNGPRVPGRVKVTEVRPCERISVDWRAPGKETQYISHYLIQVWKDSDLLQSQTVDGSKRSNDIFGSVLKEGKQIKIMAQSDWGLSKAVTADIPWTGCSNATQKIEDATGKDEGDDDRKEKEEIVNYAD